MICVSIQNKNLKEILSLLAMREIEMAEIRLDLCELSDDDIDELFSSVDKPLVATCRVGRHHSEEEFLAAEAKLLRAVEAGAAYVDVEIDAPARMGKRIRRACDECGTLLIRSCHNYSSTPSPEVLRTLRDRCFSFGGDMAKIVTMAHSSADCEVVLSLYDDARGPLIAFAMGEDGRSSRLECLRRGAPFTYAALTSEEATAPGQWTLKELRSSLSFRAEPEGRSWEISPLRMPSSKSFAQRAIIAAALAEGTSRLSGYSPCGDNEAAINAARTLGAEVSLDGDVLTIKGMAASPGRWHLGQIHAGESGLLARMLIPLLAVLSDCPTEVTGEKSLPGRPLSGAHDIMASFGVRLFPQETKPGVRPTDCCVPLTVRGPLIPGRAEVSGKGGSQLISGLLAALPLADGDSILRVEDPRSIPYMFITVDVLKRFGVSISSEMEGGEDFLESGDWSLCTGVTFRIKGGQRLKAADFEIEGDWSGAAPFLVAGAVFGSVEVCGLDTKSLQADISIIDILVEAGACISQDEEGNVRVCKAPLRAVDFDLGNCPDLFPVAAILAAFCEGESHLAGTDRLRHKETDRAEAILTILSQMGVLAAIEEDVLIIKGMPLTQRILTGNLLRGGTYPAFGDHRIAMALSVASLGAAAPIVPDDSSCLEKSFPRFLKLFLPLSE